MTSVDIAAHASEAGGANPLPTGAVETGENLSPSAGRFAEALAAQTEEGQQRPILAHTTDQRLTEDGSDAELSDSESSPVDSTTVGTEATTSEASRSDGESGAKALHVALLGDTRLPNDGMPDSAIGTSGDPASGSTDLSAETLLSARGAMQGVASQGAGEAEGSEESVGQRPKVTQGVPNASPNEARALTPSVGQLRATPNTQAAPSPVVLQPMSTATTASAPQTAVVSSGNGVSAFAQVVPTPADSIPTGSAEASGQAVTTSSGQNPVEPMSDAEVVRPLSRATAQHDPSALNPEGGRMGSTNASGIQRQADVGVQPSPSQALRSETGPVHPTGASEATETASRFGPSVAQSSPERSSPERLSPERLSIDGRSVAGPTAVPQFHDLSQGVGVVPSDGVPEPPGSLRTIVPTGPGSSESRTADVSGPAHREAQNYNDRATQPDSSVMSGATSPTDSLDPDAASDEKTALSRLPKLGVTPVKADLQAPKVVGMRETKPLLVEEPLAGGVPERPIAVVLPNLTELGGTQVAELSIGLGAAEAWRYEEVARLLEDSGRIARQTRAPVDASIVPPLESVSGWTGAAVRSSFAAPVLSNPEQLELPDQLVRGIRMQWRNGIGEAKLRLTPEHLGEVLVSLQVRQGSVSAVLRVDSEIVKDWIRTHQNELKASLAAQGLRLDELVVEEDGHADQRPGRESDNPRRRSPQPNSEARFEVRV